MKKWKFEYERKRKNKNHPGNTKERKKRIRDLISDVI